MRTVTFTWSSGSHGPLELLMVPRPCPACPVGALGRHRVHLSHMGTSHSPAWSDPLAQTLLVVLWSAGSDSCLPPKCSWTISVVKPCSVLRSVPNNRQNLTWLMVGFNLIFSFQSTMFFPPPPLKLAWFLRPDWYQFLWYHKTDHKVPFLNHTFIPVKALN